MPFSLNIPRRPSSLPARIAAAVACAAVTVLMVPSAASAQFGQVFGDYRGDQRINGCAYSPGQLQGALGQVPPDIEQYAPNFVDELNRALESRGRGDCGAQSATPTETPGDDGTLSAPGAGRVSAGPTPRPPKGAVSSRVKEISDSKAPSLEPERSTPGALAATGGVVGLIALLSLLILGARMLRSGSPSPALALGGLRAAPGEHTGASRTAERSAEERRREQEARAARRLQQRRS